MMITISSTLSYLYFSLVVVVVVGYVVVCVVVL